MWVTLEGIGSGFYKGLPGSCGWLRIRVPGRYVLHVKGFFMKDHVFMISMLWCRLRALSVVILF